MSWNITVYAERKVDDGFEFVCCLHDNFKWYIDSEYFDNLPSTTQFSPELLKLYDNKISCARTIKAADFRTDASMLIDKSVEVKKTIWCALGLPEYTDDEFEDVVNDRYDVEGNQNPNWNPLTFPVNKDLFNRLQEADFGVAKAYRIIGMLDALESMAGNEWDSDTYRLVLVRE